MLATALDTDHKEKIKIWDIRNPQNPVKSFNTQQESNINSPPQSLIWSPSGDSLVASVPNHCLKKQTYSRFSFWPNKLYTSIEPTIIHAIAFFNLHTDKQTGKITDCHSSSRICWVGDHLAFIKADEQGEKEEFILVDPITKDVIEPFKNPNVKKNYSCISDFDITPNGDTQILASYDGKMYKYANNLPAQILRYKIAQTKLPLPGIRWEIQRGITTRSTLI